LGRLLAKGTTLQSTTKSNCNQKRITAAPALCIVHTKLLLPQCASQAAGGPVLMGLLRSRPAWRCEFAAHSACHRYC
jgi:hypothetical protein